MKQENTGSFSQIAFRKLKKNPLAIISFGVIAMVAFISVFAYFLSNDKITDANQQNIIIAHQPMGFSQLVLDVPLDNYSSQTSIKNHFLGKKIDVEQIAITDYAIDQGQITYTPFLGEGLAVDPISISLEKWTNHGIDTSKIETDFIYQRTFVLGTDAYGRDFYSRLILGARISFLIGFIAVFISLVVGIPIGALAGYYRGKVDDFIMWLINVIWSIPTLLLVIAITLAIGKGFWQIFVAVGLTMWVEVARVVRGQFISFREKEFVEAARALGYSDFRILFKEILPNIMAPVIIISAANFASAILVESGLSFLGIGAQPPTPSWGNIIKENYAHIIVGQAHLALFPGIAILVLVLSFNILGNALRDAFDIKN